MGTHMEQAAEGMRAFRNSQLYIFGKFVLKRDGGKLWASLTWSRMAISGGLF